MKAERVEGAVVCLEIGEEEHVEVLALGWLDGERAMLEALTGIKRAGADLILTYFAKDAAALLRERR